MTQRTIAFLAVLAMTSGVAAHAADASPKHRHRHVAAQPYPVAEPPAPVMAGRLVLHPALNIACNTRDRPNRVLPCDQPVWVYGNPCEIDEGEGFFRDCGEPPGVGRYDRWHGNR